MPVLSHLHQLFNAEQCQTYIHTLRWQDRPLQCPRGPIGKKGATYAAFFRGVTNVWGVSPWIAADD